LGDLERLCSFHRCEEQIFLSQSLSSFDIRKQEDNKYYCVLECDAVEFDTNILYELAASIFLEECLLCSEDDLKRCVAFSLALVESIDIEVDPKLEHGRQQGKKTKPSPERGRFLKLLKLEELRKDTKYYYKSIKTKTNSMV
jgi:hypothetical protein